ncbi:DUF7342 family protein [Halovivax cerinus]|uniref:Transcriptional regulator n=1 Tax=Halovivax cerinus TaxID=1487865 RepID=A0ABD5NNF0_9EURY|nr:transcriptional regulator [Halovivax cerinus]
MDESRPDPYDDINEAVERDWKAETTPSERVKSVIRHTYTPTSAADIADGAQTSPKTARKHLTSLAEDGFVTTTAGAHGATLYRRSDESLITERANRLLAEQSAEELAERVTELRAQINEYRETYGVESPEELAVQLGRETLDDTGADTRTDGSVVTEWQTTRRNVAFANAAISIAEATEHITGDRSPSVPADDSR